MSAITCLRHDCDRKVIQLFRTTPSKCSACNQDILEGDTRYLTVIPCPFKRANQFKCDVVIALTTEQSRLGPEGLSGLHIGVCDSNGRVLEFDRPGILFDEPAQIDKVWKRCTNLDFIKQLGLDQADYKELVESVWDDTMDVTRADFTHTPYDDQANNCLNFIQRFLCRFLNELKKNDGYLSSQQVDELTDRCSDKVEFCRHFVLTKTKELARYIALDRSLQLSSNMASSQAVVNQP